MLVEDGGVVEDGLVAVAPAEGDAGGVGVRRAHQHNLVVVLLLGGE